MKLICAWCGTEIKRSGYNHTPETTTSHGMCPACSQALTSQDQGVTLQRHIDGIPVPILLVDENHATLAMNSRAAEILGRTTEPARGSKLGLVFDCVHSRLPEGCGRTVHCSGCVIRRTVANTFNTGQPQIAVPATLTVDCAEQASEIAFTITTVKNNGLVVMRIDKARQAASDANCCSHPLS